MHILLPISNDAQRKAFEDECFRAWLNRVDARVDYEVRRVIGTVSEWRWHFEQGHSENEAIADLQAAAQNRAFCGE